MTISTNLLQPSTRLVVFDLDGTLYAKSGMVLRMMCALPGHWQKMLAERKTRKQMRGQWMGEHFYANYIEALAQGCHTTSAKAQAWYEQVYMPQMVEVIRRYYPLASWVKPFVAECKSKGIRLVVLSDYGHTQEKLAALGLEVDLFDWVVSAPELGGLKPASQVLNAVIKRLEVSPAQCLVIGDRTDTDGEMAKAIGADFYLIEQ